MDSAAVTGLNKCSITKTSKKTGDTAVEVSEANNGAEEEIDGLGVTLPGTSPAPACLGTGPAHVLLRGWWRRQSFRHGEIEGFEIEEYAKRKLVVLVLKPKAQANRGLEDSRIAFPCAFGSPVEQVIETLQDSLKKQKV